MAQPSTVALRLALSSLGDEQGLLLESVNILFENICVNPQVSVAPRIPLGQKKSPPKCIIVSLWNLKSSPLIKRCVLPWDIKAAAPSSLLFFSDFFPSTSEEKVSSWIWWQTISCRSPPSQKTNRLGCTKGGRDCLFPALWNETCNYRAAMK